MQSIKILSLLKSKLLTGVQLYALISIKGMNDDKGIRYPVLQLKTKDTTQKERNAHRRDPADAKKNLGHLYITFT